MIYKRIDKRYPYMAMLCEIKDKYFVETLLCSGGGKMGIRDIHWRAQWMDLAYNLITISISIHFLYQFSREGDINADIE